jgi:peroxiredoxin
MFDLSHALRKFVAVPAVALMLTAGIIGTSTAATVGDAAPAFSLPAADGATVALEDFKGRVVVLEWFNKECPFVRKHYDSRNMQNLQKEMAARDVVWLTVSSAAEGKQGHETAEEALATLAKEEAAPAHYLFDADGTVGKLYDAKTTPHMFVIDQEGKLVYAGAIDDKASAYVSDIEGAKNYVRAAVEEVLAGKPVTEASTKSYGCGVKYAD